MGRLGMRSKTIIIIGLLLCSFWFGGTAWADRVDQRYQKVAKRYHELYRNTPFRDKAHNWINTINQFEWIYNKYPRHARAPQSLLNIGNLYRSLHKWNKKQIYLDRSSIFFRKLTNEYPQSSLADNGQYLLAENYELFKKDKDLAFLEYQKLIDQYPNTSSARKAREKIKTLQPPPKDLQIAPKVEEALAPVDLSKARYGGLSVAENQKKNSPSLVSSVDYWSTSDWSRMVINVKEGVRYKYQGLGASGTKGRRIYVDIFNSYLPKKFKHRIAANDGLIKQARVAQFDKKTVRVVLDMASVKKIKVFHLKLRHQYKIIIDILGQSALPDLKVAKGKSLKSKTNPSGKKIAIQKNLKTAQMVSLSKALGLKVKRIIIDPGHGGRDPGALAFGLMEKDIALKMGLLLKQIIEKKHPEMEVLMTRSKDEYLSLDARTAFANKTRGDLFISIHLNASHREKVKGIETYFLNLTSDNYALSVAAKENQSSLKSISELQNILNDLMTNSKIQESSELAQMIQKATYSAVKQSKQYKTRDLGVKQAPFFVLLGAQMPSILIESGFITNRKENRLLRTAKYQRVIAEGIYRGIRQYMN
ncbi:MAG: hypothetical protein COB67_12750 [SAR324 cluster bacterium]|uniref:MurNAc-LAA domain-containing protein n=1 Tax=SAR324 cluster bacterium TaxID=2024889 RepID=A0A2A4SQ61_9DELT|nr:MAG: hypothetical protein COB67_12750 [SAR324 cluster bacterium]